jgi:hypothetical protein
MHQDLGLSWSDGVDPEIVRAEFAKKNITVLGGDDPNRKFIISKIRMVNDEVAAA